MVVLTTIPTVGDFTNLFNRSDFHPDQSPIDYA